MSTQDLYIVLNEEIGDNLSGQLTYAGDVIKYEYDGFQNFDHDGDGLEDICYEDRCMIDEWLESDDEYSSFLTTEPEIHDRIIYFYIEL